MHTYASSTLHNHVIFICDLLTPGLMHAEVLQSSLCVPSLVIIARVVFLLQTHSYRCH